MNIINDKKLNKIKEEEDTINIQSQHFYPGKLEDELK